ncbi:MAG: hypothetical protein ACRCX2_33750 [Paraclostridium sp.]
MRKILILLVIMLSTVACSSTGYTVDDMEKYDMGTVAINEVREKYEAEGVIHNIHYTRAYLESAYTVIRVMSGEFGENATNADYRYAQIQEVISWDITFEKEKNISQTTLTEDQYNIVQIYEEEQIQYCNDLKDILIEINNNFDGSDADYISDAKEIYDNWYKNARKIADTIAANTVMNMIGN